MKQPSKNVGIVTVKSKIKRRIKPKAFKKSKNASELDGSGLEYFFRINILDKLGIKYSQQFKAKSIGRFYDFILLDYRIIIECDGTFFHSDPRIYKDSLTITQKRNKRVDEIKNKWAQENYYVLLRFWEKDIYNDVPGIIKFLTEKIGLQTEVILLNESKKNGSFFMKNN